MSIIYDAVQSAKTNHLQLDIEGGASLAQVIAQVNGICEQEEEHPSVVILRFIPSSVPSLQKWPKGIGIQEVNRWEKAVRRLERHTSAIIAFASGITEAPGMDLLLIADYRIVTTDFRLQIPLNDGHFWPGMAIYRLVNQVGMAVVRQILLGRNEITAQRALDLALIDEISDALPNTNTLLKVISRFDLMSNAEISIRRQLLLEATTTTFEDALGTHLAACDRELRRLRDRGVLEDQQENGQ